MDYKQKISDAISYLTSVSNLLIELKHRLSELTPKETPEIFSGEFLTNFDDERRRRAKIEDLQLNKSNEKGVSSVKIKEEEIEKMLLELKGVFISPTQRKDGRFYGYITLNKKRIFAYGKSIKEVKRKIADIAENGYTRKREKSNTQNFKTFTMHYFETFRKRKVAVDTYTADMNRLKLHVFPYLEKKSLKSITPTDCQKIVDRLAEAKKGKTADEVYSLLSIIFKGAIAHGYIKSNPILLVYKEAHEREHGVALTKAEIEYLKKKLEGNPLLKSFMIYLYTGVRPNELATIRIEEPFIIAVNSKRKTKKVQYKKIPIIEQLRPYLVGDVAALPTSSKYLARAFKQLLPKHSLKDLRTTFYSKCKECGVEEPALKEFVGHSDGKLGDAYTSLSDEYLLKEAKKIVF